MTVVTPQVETSASESALRRELDLPETTLHLVNQIASMLHKAGLRPMARCQQEAQDIAQQCMKLAWGKRADFQPEKGEPGAWLHGIAWRMTSSHLRGLQRWPQALPAQDTSAILSENLFDSFDFDKVKQLLPMLSPRDQDLIRCSYLQEMPPDLLRLELNLTAGALRTGKCRVLKKLRELYQKIFPEDAS